MFDPRKLAVCFAALLAICALQMPVCAAPNWLTRPGTIAHAITQPDGAAVYLDDVDVVKLKGHQNPAYFVVGEPWEKDSLIIVSAAPPEALRMNQSVDIQGTLGTLPSGLRAVMNPRVIGYYNESGVLYKRGPIMKSITGITSWDWKTDLPLSTDPIPGDAIQGEPNLDTPPAPVFHDTIASLLTNAGSDALLGKSAVLQCKNIIGSGVDPVNGEYLILGDELSTSTIKVYSGTSDQSTGTASMAAAVNAERVNDVSGQVQIIGGEAALVLNEGPNFNPEGLYGSVKTVVSGTTSFAKSLVDGSIVNIPGVVVTDYNPLTQVAYVEDTNRTGGIRIVYIGRGTIERGSAIDFTGKLRTNADGERELLVGDPIIKSVSVTGTVIEPVYMISRHLGGTSFNAYTPGVNHPLPGTGLYNKGMLVKISGKVTAVDQAAKCFFVDDGSVVRKLIPGQKPIGLNTIVKVVWSSEGDPVHIPAVGDFLDNIVGISSSEAIAPDVYSRVLRLRYLSTPAVTGTALSKLVNLSWVPKDHASYRIYRSESESGPFSLISTVAGGSYTNTGLVNGTTYYYKVSAIESGLESAGSLALALTPIGGSPTVITEYDAATSTYTYTVTCPENNQYSFGYMEVRTLVANSAPTGPWTTLGAIIGGINLDWPFASSEWNAGTGQTAAIWNVLGGNIIPVNTAAVAKFKLVVPESEPVQGTAVIKGDESASTISYDVLVPSVIRRDPPTSAINLTGTLGSADWYVSPVTAAISATDPDNDYLKSFFKLDDMAAEWVEYQSELQIDTDGEHQIAVYSVDAEGNSEDPDNPVVLTFKIDATAPSVSGTLVNQPNISGWHNSDVTVNFTAADITSGLETPEAADPGVSINFSDVVSGEGADLSATGSAVDKAGNTGTTVVSGIKIDKTAPGINILSAPSGFNYIINYDTVVIRFTVSDAVSGIDGLPWAVVDIVPTGGWANPSSSRVDAVSVGSGIYEVRLSLQIVGAYTVNLFAKDKADNTAQASVPVSFSAGGFSVEWLPPISTMETYVMQDGSTVPVKFRLLDQMNNSIYVNSYLYTMKVMDTANKVWLQVSIPAPDFGISGYMAVVKTKDANNVDWPVGDYTVIIEGPGIWDVVSGPYRSRYGLQIVDKGVAKGAGKR